MRYAFFLILLCVLFSGAIAQAQPLQPDMDVFARRREALSKQLPPQGVVILPCKPEYVRNGDVEYEYRQESNFYYLSGFEESESIILMNPAAARNKFVLFVQPANPAAETWTGKRAGIEGAMRFFRADTAIAFADFTDAVANFIPSGGTLYYPFGTNPKLDERIRARFSDGEAAASWTMRDPSPFLAEMRLIKNDGDWSMGFTRAIDISAQAQVEAIKTIRPGMYEYEVQAVFEYVYRKNGSPRNGYPCIIGSGPNSCVLHYDSNNRRMNAGDMVVMDCGAEFGYYSADITRTVPVSGRFTPEQRAIYQIVLDAQTAVIAAVKPGITHAVLDSTLRTFLGNGLVRLGLLKDPKDENLFSLHGFSHWLGLEVHDVGKIFVNGKQRTLEPGMVFTIEPGIYVRPQVLDALKDRGYTEAELAKIRPVLERYMHIGVRIEDDVAVTETGGKNLSEATPRSIEAIEHLMRH
jgi:Xaa-Pro aminopeptidase